MLHRILENCEKLAKTYNGEEVGVRATQGDECENCENSVNSITVSRWGLGVRGLGIRGLGISGLGLRG